MNDKLIYLDTNLWNGLLDQNVDPQRLAGELNLKHVNLVLSDHAIYELGKTYVSNPVRAQNLFRHLKQYVDVGIISALDAMEQLDREVSNVMTQVPVVAFCGVTELAALKARVDRLAQGNYDIEEQSRAATWDNFARSTRTDQNAHFVNKDKHVVRDRLKCVSKDKLEGWLQSEELSPRGIEILTGRLISLYGESISVEDARALACELLSSLSSRAAKGLVRANLYSNWWAAQHDSIRKDLVPDIYHVLNANYCSVYTTAEQAQTMFAALVLSDHTQVAIYDGQTPIEAWLLER